jgi:hypothetical protein
MGKECNIISGLYTGQWGKYDLMHSYFSEKDLLTASKILATALSGIAKLQK